MKREKPKKTAICVRVSADVADVLRKTAEQRGMVQAAIVENALWRELRDLAQLPPPAKGI